MSDECKDFIRRCLSKEEKYRLGSVTDVDEVMTHPWMKRLDLDLLMNKKIKAPFIPNISKNKYDMKHFDQSLVNI